MRREWRVVGVALVAALVWMARVEGSIGLIERIWSLPRVPVPVPYLVRVTVTNAAPVVVVIGEATQRGWPTASLSLQPVAGATITNAAGPNE